MNYSYKEMGDIVRDYSLHTKVITSLAGMLRHNNYLLVCKDFTSCKPPVLIKDRGH